MLRKEKNPAGLGGASYYLSDRADWQALPPVAQKVVSPGLRQLFERYPASLVETAGEQDFGPLSRFMAAAADGQAVLEVHLSKYVRPSAALTVFERGRRRFSFTGPDEPPPMQAVEPLASLHRTVGGVRLDYMVSGSILPAGEVLGVDAFRQQFSNAYDIPAGIREGWAFYEVNGDYLFYTRQGGTFWLGSEHYTGAPGASHRPLSEAVQAILFSMLKGERYHGD